MKPKENKPNNPRQPRGRGRQQGGGQQRANGNGNGNGGRSVSRGAAIRAARRSVDDATKIANRYIGNGSIGVNKPVRTRRANQIDDSPKLKIIGLGGMDGIGSKNTIVIEYQNDAIVMDCGNDLSIELPGVNYGIADTTYLDQIKNKIRAFVITHGHLDHTGGMTHVLPKFNVPVYGSRFTIGMVEKAFENASVPMPDGFELKTVIMNPDTHERLKIGPFFVELVRVTHNIPESTLVVVDTPVGRIINSGDFRLDPSPFSGKPSDMERLKQIGKEGVLVYMGESTNTERIGRVESEKDIEPSITQLMEQAPGRVFISIFSSNVDRIQMAINAAVKHGRKIALDGRSIVGNLEMAVRNGFMKIPKGMVVPISAVSSLKDNEVVVVCTGSQGEPNASLQRMSTGDHAQITLKESDTVILSSSVIPGNDQAISEIINDMMKKGVHVYRHTTHQLDNVGILHVSGHGGIDEYAEMIQMLKPKFFVPIYGDWLHKSRHIDIAIEQGVPRSSCLNAENGDVISVGPDSMEVTGQVPHGTVLIDQTGSPVSPVVVKDRVLLAEEGMVAVVLTIDKKSGQLLTSPDIISRGFIYMKDSEDLMTDFRNELKRAVQQRFKRVDLDRFKSELKDYVQHFLYERTQRSPIVIPVVNVIGGRVGGPKPIDQSNGNAKPEQAKTPEEIAAEQQRRFAQLRQRLLNHDAKTE